MSNRELETASLFECRIRANAIEDQMDSFPARSSRRQLPPPNARRRHSARDFRTTSARRLFSRIEWLPGPPSRILRPGHGLEIWEPPPNGNA